MITKFTTSTGEYLAVGVPEGAYNFDSLKQNSGNTRLFWDRKEDDYSIIDDYDEGIDLPHGNYALIATTPITEDQAAEIVDRKGNGYALYEEGGKYWVLTARQSFTSLLTSLGVQGRCAILKII